MSTTTTTTPLATPDPWLTSEQFGALAATIITNLIVLFGFDMSDARQASLLALVNAAYVVAIMVHAAVVRNGRSRSQNPVAPVITTSAELERLLAPVITTSGERGERLP